MIMVRVVVVLMVALVLFRVADALRIGAFNMKQLGPTKASKTDIMARLAAIVDRFDIVALQEITESNGGLGNGPAINSLLGLARAESGRDLQMVLSPRLGRCSSKEEYAYVYDASKVALLDTYVFADPDDIFERDPFSALWRIYGRTNITTTVVHVRPKVTPTTTPASCGPIKTVHNTASEIAALPLAVDAARVHFGLPDLRNDIILGDLNADCTYMAQYKWAPEYVPFRFDPQWDWLIDNDADTAVSSSHCAYDRIIVRFDQAPWLQYSPARVFEFAHANLTDASDVSDHWPVEFDIVIPQTLNRRAINANCMTISNGDWCRNRRHIRAIKSNVQ